MSMLYVARSPTVQEWGSDVGLTEHLYKVGVADDSAEAAVEALNQAAYAGATDWQLVKAAPTDKNEAAVTEKLSRKEKLVEPNFYPKIQGASGILKVKLANVQNRLLVQQMMSGDDEKKASSKKPKPPDIAEYLIQDALA
jgi:hypothetical protein